jgi:hypothetical protein
MLIIQSQRPPAAADLVLIFSAVKSGLARVGLIALKLLGFTYSASTNALKPLRVSRKAAGLPMRLNAVYHGFSVFSLPFLSTGTFGSIPQRRWRAHVNVVATASGGVLRAFSIRKSSILRPARAAIAFSTSGRAASRSFWTEFIFISTAVLISKHFLASSSAMAF